MKNFIKAIISFVKCLLFGLKYHKGLYIGIGAKIVGGGIVELAEDVFIMPYSLICSVGGKIKIGKYSQIGMFSRVASQVNIEIGNNVITGPNVFIADYNHEYKDPYKPIMFQGTRVNRKNIDSEPILTIGEGTWIGTNVVIVGTVSIGRNCIIGANSVVVNDIPDFSVAVGSPCKVIKQYDFKRKEWVKVKYQNIQNE